MDFKVCGTARRHHRHPDGHQDRRPHRARSCTQALDQAREGRLHILGKMPETLSDAARRAVASTRRASPPSRSSRTRSATSSAPAARPSRASSSRRASRSTSRTTARSTSRRPTATPCRRRSTSSRASRREAEVGADLQGHRQAHHGLRRLRRDHARHGCPASRASFIRADEASSDSMPRDWTMKRWLGKRNQGEAPLGW